jgi:hypothetical protein
MIDPFEANKNEPTMLRSENETDRSPEFKKKRAELVMSINNYLTDLAKKRDTKQPLGDGAFLLDESRIVTTNLGRSGYNTNLMATEKYRGVSLTGNNIETPLILQAVITNPRTGDIEVIEAQGSDPISLLVNGTDFSLKRQQEIVAMFGVEDAKGPYFKYSVYGNGSVEHRSYYGDVHKGRAFRDVDSIEIAQVAFGQIVQDLNFLE